MYCRIEKVPNYSYLTTVPDPFENLTHVYLSENQHTNHYYCLSESKYQKIFIVTYVFVVESMVLQPFA